MFVNAEQVAGPTALFDDAYHHWHERQALELGTSDTDWEHAVASMRHDRTASVERQLGWLRDTGFADADCLWKVNRPGFGGGSGVLFLGRDLVGLAAA